MDVPQLLQCFAATLEFDATARHNAESLLKEISKNPGFLGACLDIIGSNDPANPIPDNIKMSASLYFKNKVVYGWNSESGYIKNEMLGLTVDIDEKPVVKDMLVQTMCNCAKDSPNCMKILQSALTVIISEDYPRGKWETLLPKSIELISQGDINLSHVGLICLAEIFRTYRWKENDSRQESELLILNYFPSLLQFANENLLQDGNNVENAKIGELLKLIVKIYKFITYHDLPFILQRNDFFIPWANLFVKIIQLPIPQSLYSNGSDKSDWKNNPWIKCKKWSYANLYKLFQRYASSSLSRKFEYTDFKNLYVNDFLPQFLQLLFEQIEQWGNQNLWLSNESIYYILSFFEQCATQKKIWPVIAPHHNTILRHVIFPLLTMNEETLDIFENDPQEYIHRYLEYWDNDYSPDLAACALSITIANKHTKTTIQPTMEFILEILQNNTTNGINNITLENAVKIESALKIMSNILDILLRENSPYIQDIEKLLKTFVFPLFHSQFGFLKSRTCEICSKLGLHEFQDTKCIETILEGIMICLNDSSNCYLPINLSASLALQVFIETPFFKKSLTDSVVPIMQKLLALSNEFESDSISGVMQDFVEQFAEQLQPFGVELMTSLVQQFLKLAIDLNEAANIDPSNFNNPNDIPDESDKQMAALGILSTMISILLSFENSIEIVKKLEQSFYPAAEFILKNDLEDFYRELSEFLENSTFLLREVSPITWKILELVGENNSKEDSMISFYIEDFMLMLNNIIVYGSEELKKNGFYSRIIFDIYQKYNIDEDTSLDELVIIFDLSQKLILSLDNNLPHTMREIFLRDSLKAILVERTELKKNIVFNVTSFNVILASITTEPLLTLQYLQQNNGLKLFLETWLTFNLPNFTRVYDIKLSAMAILSVLTHMTPEQYQELSLDANIVSQFGLQLLTLMEKYPKAEEELKEKRKEYTGDSAMGLATINGGKNDNTWTIDVEDEQDAEEDDEEDFEALLSSLKKDNGIEFAEGYEGENFDDLEEDPLTKSILEDLNMYQMVRDSINHLQQSPVYPQISAQWTPEKQQLLQQIMHM